MASQFLKDIASGALLGTTPGVTRPTVKAPSPFDNEEVDRDYRKFGITSYVDPASYSSADSSAYSQSDGNDPYRGPLDVSGMTQSVADQFVGMDKYLGMGLAPMGLNPFISTGSFISKKNLENIEKNIAEGKEGYALGMLNGRIVGVSPGVFGGSVLSGVLPSGLSAEQRRQLTSNLLSTREMAENPKDFAVSPTPTPELTDAEMVSAGSANIVTDSSGRPVTQGGDPNSSGYGSYVTTGQGQYVDPGIIQDQGDAMTAAAEAATSYANTTADDFNFDAPVISEPSPPPPPPPSSPPPDFVTYAPPQEDDEDQSSGNQYSVPSSTPSYSPSEMEDAYQEEAYGSPSDDSNDTTNDKGGNCCFIMLEARYGDGTMDDVVRRYRDEYMTDRNKRGYYKVAEVLVPLMRKSRLAKWLVTKTFADPLVSYGKYYYGQNKHGVIFAPVKSFWMWVFNIVGGETEFIRENGKVV